MKKPETDFLSPENCNKAKCKTCIFGDTPVKLSPEREAEIQLYLATGAASHVCHTTEKTCYGALEYQAKIFHGIGILKYPTVECLLQKAKEVLNK